MASVGDVRIAVIPLGAFAVIPYTIGGIQTVAMSTNIWGQRNNRCATVKKYVLEHVLIF